MKVKVDPDACIACGACISLVPEVFNWMKKGESC